MADNIARVLAAAVADNPTRPMLTWYDDASGERVELSGETLANWVAKTANLLVDDVALGPGDTAAVLLPPHWQTAAVLLGCWSVGLEVTGEPAPADVVFAAVDRTDEAAASGAGDRYVLGFAPMGLPLRETPAGFADYVAAVRAQGDHFTPYHEEGPQDAELLARAARRAADLGLRNGVRVLFDADRHPDPVDWLLAPLSAGASVVLCGHLDPGRLADRLASEKVTVSLA